MSFHTILKTSKDYYSALRWARRLTDRLETAINANLTDDQVRVPRRPEISLKIRTKCLWHPSFSFEGSRPRLVGVQQSSFWVELASLASGCSSPEVGLPRITASKNNKSCKFKPVEQFGQSSKISAQWCLFITAIMHNY